MATQKQRLYGFLMVIVGAAFWGLSGTVAQHLFETSDVSVEWLVTVRLLLSGLLVLIIVSAGKNRRAVWGIWKDKKAAVQLIVFGIAGMLGVQYTFLASIGTGNAAVATLLQYLAPVLIMLYLLLTRKNSFQFSDFRFFGAIIGFSRHFFAADEWKHQQFNSFSFICCMGSSFCWRTCLLYAVFQFSFENMGVGSRHWLGDADRGRRHELYSSALGSTGRRLDGFWNCIGGFYCYFRNVIGILHVPRKFEIFIPARSKHAGMH